MESQIKKTNGAVKDTDLKNTNLTAALSEITQGPANSTPVLNRELEILVSGMLARNREVKLRVLDPLNADWDYVSRKVETDLGLESGSIGSDRRYDFAADESGKPVLVERNPLKLKTEDKMA